MKGYSLNKNQVTHVEGITMTSFQYHRHMTQVRHDMCGRGNNIHLCQLDWTEIKSWRCKEMGNFTKSKKYVEELIGKSLFCIPLSITCLCHTWHLQKRFAYFFRNSTLKQANHCIFNLSMSHRSFSHPENVNIAHRYMDIRYTLI